jgi:hypothetical protein
MPLKGMAKVWLILLATAVSLAASCSMASTHYEKQAITHG